jgi:diguanylate cyclase (GGDEF)-like protein
MTEFHQISQLATVVQAAGTVLVAALLLPLSRSMPGRFLRLWAAGWMCQTAGMAALLVLVRSPDWARGPLMAAYLLCGYLFAFLVWAGCRKLAAGQDLVAADWLRLAGPAAFAVAAPLVTGGRVWLAFPAHAAVMAALFAFALAAAGRLPAEAAGGPGVGRWLVRGALATLVLLFAHYAVTIGGLGWRPPDYPYLAYASLYDVLLQTALAFGLVVLAADHSRAVLAERNRALAAAAAELAAAARTDPLTGLLNRRGFEQVLASHAAGPYPGAVAVLDLNDLKRLNDRWGHPAGDAALRLVARALQARFRVTDPVCRTGGDEFVVVLPAGTEGELADRLDGLTDDLTGHRLPGVPGPVDLRVAWGVCGFDAHLPAAFAAADRTMYARKWQMKASALTVMAGEPSHAL